MPQDMDNRGVSRQRQRNPRRKNTNPLLDARAIQVARGSLEELGDGEVGEHIGVSMLGPNVATHRFQAAVPGYHGWEWNAVLACAEGSRHVTVNEVALVPAHEALQAPDWVPYEERVRPGDLGPGDLMPPMPGDERLDKVEGRYRISRHGLEEARHRWHTGDYGPTSEFAEKAALHCRSCAFYLKVEGAIGENFGVCANEYSADGHLVHATYGCGAHSETPPTPSQGEEPPSAFDDELPVDY
ncbi:hypothetical protein COCCU_03710 [Corynebacterium occultum]|uniref:DUF3027 domain-containing protein n=1 Tax=Corynebacterium occultum TaxID=2675219 RepID=A0A6B8W2H9_9CORY|nr:hypothetical protein COCCU_03710 [Corynebacterium occultum]